MFPPCLIYTQLRQAHFLPDLSLYYVTTPTARVQISQSVTLFTALSNNALFSYLPVTIRSFFDSSDHWLKTFSKQRLYPVYFVCSMPITQMTPKPSI